jgi:hypothetical protein
MSDADNNLTPPASGEQTLAQSKDNSGNGLANFIGAALGRGFALSSNNEPKGFDKPKQGDYDCYREMSSQPTIALIQNGVVAPPIISNTWNYEKRGSGRKYKKFSSQYNKQVSSGVKDEIVDFVRETIEPLRQDIVAACVRGGNQFGWTPAEPVWEKVKNRQVPIKFKPLLWDISELLFDKFGNIGGIRNKSPESKDPVDLTGANAFVYRFGAGPDFHYGRPRHENCRVEWSESRAVRNRLAQYLKKQATTIAQLHYPPGTAQDESGADRPTQYLAQRLLNNVNEGNSVMLPNMYASFADLRQGLEYAGKTSWVLSYLNPGPGDHTTGILSALRYYDIQFCRGWLVPERAALEAEHGSRADSHEHKSIATINAELQDQQIAEAVTQQIIRPLLILNFGPEYADAVYIDPTDIEDDAVMGFLQVITAELANPILGPWLATVMDQGGILDRLGIPINEKMRDMLLKPPMAQLGSTGTNDNPQDAGLSKTETFPPQEPAEKAAKPTMKEQKMRQMYKDAGYDDAWINDKVGKKKAIAAK